MDNPSIAEIQVSYLPMKSCGPCITSSRDTFNVLAENWNKETIRLLEEFKVLLLNRANRLIGVHSLSKGGISATIVDIRLVFGVALKTASTSIILAHNHPSGQLKPSKDDLWLTQKIKESGDLLDIKVLDHLIINDTSYFSFADEGLI